MTREECEKAIMKKIREAIDILHVYDPECDYLSVSYINDDGDEWAHIHNHPDSDLPIDYSTTRREIEI